MMSDLSDVLRELRKLRSPELWTDIASQNVYADGIIGDPNKWFSQRQRILFLSKEPNDAPGLADACRADDGVCDLCKVYRERPIGSGHRRRFEKNLGRWAFGIDAVNAGRAAEFSSCTDDDAYQALLRCAVVNLKKAGGAGRVGAGIAAYVRKRAKLLRRQMELLAPSVVVCCGTGRYVKQVWGVELGGEFLWHGPLFLDQYHPSAFRSDSWLFNELVQRYRRAKAAQA
jgi:hypothetical protein